VGGRYVRGSGCEEDCDCCRTSLIVCAVDGDGDRGVVVLEARKVLMPEFSGAESDLIVASGCMKRVAYYLGPMCPSFIFFAKSRCIRCTSGEMTAAPGPSLMSRS